MTDDLRWLKETLDAIPEPQPQMADRETIEALIGCERFMADLSRPPCPDCADLVEACAMYEDRHKANMQVMAAQDRAAEDLLWQRDVLLSRNTSLRAALFLASAVIVALVWWMVAR